VLFRSIFHPHNGPDRDAETDVYISGGEDLFGRGQGGGVAKLADRFRLEVNGLRGKNSRIDDHLAGSLNTQAKRIDANEFWG
jgi:hypothetical protein